MTQAEIEARLGELHDTLAELARDYHEAVIDITGAIRELVEQSQALAVEQAVTA